jgi:NADPH:quinone reductase-like Zn-dependent oxidoreductase
MTNSAPSASRIRCVEIPRFGGVEVMRVRDVAAPALDPASARVGVRAAGINFADLMMRLGLYPEAPARPFVPGYEIAGTILEIGSDAKGLPAGLVPGAHVLAVTRFGGYAEEVCVPARKVFALPAGWSFEEGAAFPVVFLTAWLALRAMARVREGDRVLIHGIAGGVGLAALQIARAHGARVSGTCGSEEKAAVARARGAEHTILYTKEDIPAAVRAWAPGGVDIILEPRGGKGLRESLGLLKPTGRVVSFGVREMVSGGKPDRLRAALAALRLLWLSPLRLIQSNAGVFGLNLLRLWNDDELLGWAMRELLEGAAAGTYRPVVDRSFPLEEAGAAHRYLHERRNTGKVVLTTGR